MPKIPIFQPSVAVRPVEVPQPQVLRPPEEAFGGDVAQARGAQGQQIQKTAGIAANRMIEIQQRDDEKVALDQATKFQADLQNKLSDPTVDENGVPKGFLARQLGQAKGATPQFDATAQELKKQYMEGVTAPELQNQMSKVFDTHLSAAREQVIHHEAAQRTADFSNSLDSNIKANVAAAATLTDPKDVMKAITVAQAQATGGYMHLGLDEASVAYKNKELAGNMVKSAVFGVMEQSPTAAKVMLEKLKGQMNADDAVALTKTVDQKMIYDIVQRVSDVAQTMRMADGMIDRSRVDAYVKTLGLTAEETYQVTSHVDHLAMVDYSEQMNKRKDAERSMLNEALEAQSKGVPYDQALKLGSKYGWDSTSIANMEAEVTKLYENPQDRFNSWISKQPQATQSAWKEAEMAIKAKYPQSNVTGEIGGVKQSLQQSAIDELKQDALGKSADQIRDLAKQKMDKVIIGPYHFLGITLPINKTAPGWMVDANDRATISAANTMLEKAYGTDRVGRAKSKLIQGGIPVTPSNLKKVLDASVQRSGDNQ